MLGLLKIYLPLAEQQIKRMAKTPALRAVKAVLCERGAQVRLVVLRDALAGGLDALQLAAPLGGKTLLRRRQFDNRSVVGARRAQVARLRVEIALGDERRQMPRFKFQHLIECRALLEGSAARAVHPRKSKPRARIAAAGRNGARQGLGRGFKITALERRQTCGAC